MGGFEMRGAKWYKRRAFVVQRAAIVTAKICRKKVVNYKMHFLNARGGNRTTDRMVGVQGVVHWAEGSSCKEWILIQYIVESDNENNFHE
jgi:hypothetical protein